MSELRSNIFVMSRGLFGDYKRMFRQQGETAERERIIKLLEEEHPCPLKGSHHSLGVCSCLAIALIKGENK